jgi:hypothetical protein
MYDHTYGTIYRHLVYIVYGCLELFAVI